MSHSHFLVSEAFSVLSWTTSSDVSHAIRSCVCSSLYNPCFLYVKVPLPRLVGTFFLISDSSNKSFETSGKHGGGSNSSSARSAIASQSYHTQKHHCYILITIKYKHIISTSHQTTRNVRNNITSPNFSEDSRRKNIILNFFQRKTQNSISIKSWP